ncbi:MAG: hypothetical protein HGB12_15915 [Bacteroidetes bacterium]|nr:hypothetical protein [Bacteroidota bacterium]
MKKWIKIILLLAVAGIIAAFLIFRFYINKSHPDFEKMPAEYSLNAENLYKEFTSNKDLSEKKYNGKVIEINGALSKVESVDSLSVAVFVYKQGDFGDEGIRCTMLRKYNDEAQKITTGTIVKIKGFCSGYNETDIIFEKASFVKE